KTAVPAQAAALAQSQAASTTKGARRLPLSCKATRSAEEVLDPIRPGLALGRVFFTPVRQGGFKLAQQFLLLVGQADRRFQRDVAIQIAGIAGTHAANAFAAQAEDFAGLRSFRNRDRAASAQCRHLQLAAQRRRGERDRQLAVQVVAIALEDRVRLDVHLNVEVARRAAVDTRLAITTGADAHAVIDPRRNVDRQGFRILDLAPAMTVGARIRNFLAAAAAGRAGLLHAEKTLLDADHARAAASVAGFGFRAGL